MTGMGCMQWQGRRIPGIPEESGSVEVWKSGSGSVEADSTLKRRCRHPHQRCFDHLRPTRPQRQHSNMTKCARLASESFGLIIVKIVQDLYCRFLLELSNNKRHRLGKWVRIGKSRKEKLLSMISPKNKSSPGIHD